MTRVRVKGSTGSTALDVFVYVALVGLLAAIYLAIAAWLLMLILGALYNDVWSAIPPLGYWQCVLVIIAINIIGGIVWRRG